jgi:hypothetical protein
VLMVVGGLLPPMHTPPGVPSTPGGAFVTTGDGLSQPSGTALTCSFMPAAQCPWTLQMK